MKRHRDSIQTEIDGQRIELDEVPHLVPIAQTRFLIDLLVSRGGTASANTAKVLKWLTDHCGVPASPMVTAAVAVWVGVAHLSHARKQRTAQAKRPPVEPTLPLIDDADQQPMAYPGDDDDSTGEHRGPE